MRKIDNIAYDDHFVSVGGRLNPSFGNVSNTGILLPRLFPSVKEGSNKDKENPKALHTLKFGRNHLTSTSMKFFPILKKMYHRLPCDINRDFWSEFLSKLVRPR